MYCTLNPSQSLCSLDEPSHKLITTLALRDTSLMQRPRSRESAISTIDAKLDG